MHQISSKGVSLDNDSQKQQLPNKILKEFGQLAASVRTADSQAGKGKGKALRRK